jgi:hypothetical protein
MLDRFLFVQRTCAALFLLLRIFCSTVFMARAEAYEEYWAKVNALGKPAAVFLA